MCEGRRGEFFYEGTSTVNIQVKALKNIISFFKNKDWVDSSVNVKLIKADIEPIEAYTDEEIKSIK